MDNFDLKKYLAEGKLYEAINLDIEDDIAILSGDSGEYEGEIEDGKASFSVIYDDLDYRISDQYNENNIEDFLGKGHAFVELAKKYDYNWDIERDLVGITIKLKDLAEGKLLKENNEFVDSIKKSDLKIVDQYLKIKKESQDLEHDVSDFLEDFSKNEVEELDRDLPNGLQYDLIEIYKEQDWDPDNSPYSSPESAEENDIGETMLDYDFADNPNLSPPGDPGKYIFPLGPLSHL